MKCILNRCSTHDIITCQEHLGSWFELRADHQTHWCFSGSVIVFLLNAWGFWSGRCRTIRTNIFVYIRPKETEMQNSTECAGNIILIWCCKIQNFLQHFLMLCYFMQAVNSDVYIVESNLKITVQGVLIFSRCITASIPVWYGMSRSDTKNYKRQFPVVIESSLSESSTVC